MFITLSHGGNCKVKWFRDSIVYLSEGLNSKIQLTVPTVKDVEQQKNFSVADGSKISTVTKEIIMAIA